MICLKCLNACWESHAIYGVEVMERVFGLYNESDHLQSLATLICLY